jgi:hypothetical protein
LWIIPLNYGYRFSPMADAMFTDFPYSFADRTEVEIVPLNAAIHPFYPRLYWQSRSCDFYHNSF